MPTRFDTKKYNERKKKLLLLGKETWYKENPRSLFNYLLFTKATLNLNTPKHKTRNALMAQEIFKPNREEKELPKIIAYVPILLLADLSQQS